MVTESGAAAAAAAASAAIESGNWEQRSEASDAQHLVGNSGRVVGGTSESTINHCRSIQSTATVSPLSSLSSVDFHVVD